MKRIVGIVLAVLAAVAVEAEQYQDSAVWQGWNIKLDLGSTAFELARSKAKVQNYEMALNFNLLQRFYPTLELGYARADRSAEGGNFFGQGGFARVGLDLSALKKSRKDNMLLVGVRLGTAVQDYRMSYLSVSDNYWGYRTQTAVAPTVRADVWGEVVAGVQVQIYKAFHMGWYVRLRVLFTRSNNGKPTPYYIPGFGYKDDTQFGLNYYVGFKL